MGVGGWGFRPGERDRVNAGVSIYCMSSVRDGGMAERREGEYVVIKRESERDEVTEIERSGWQR